MSLRAHNTDRKNVPAALADLKAARLANLQAPVMCADGKVFQFSRDDKETIEAALRILAVNSSLSLNWRLLDNSEVVVSHALLGAYLDELNLLQAQRGVVVDAEYVAFKQAGNYTRRDLKNWEGVYAGGYIPPLAV